LASYDKIVKHIVENFQASLSPLREITKNQQIIIVQNKQIIDQLEKISSRTILTSTESDIESAPESAEAENENK
jgi:hypothetical protein